MKVTRMPHEIFLIEHIFYPVVAIIFIALATTYGGKFALRLTNFSPQDIGQVLGTGAVIVSFIISTILIPFSCARLWVSSNNHLSGFWCVVSKIYAGSLFSILVFYGALTLIEIRNIIETWQELTNE